MIIQKSKPKYNIHFLCKWLAGGGGIDNRVWLRYDWLYSVLLAFQKGKYERIYQQAAINPGA